MTDDLHTLRAAVDDATAHVIDATARLEAAREVEREAAAKRSDAEGVRNAALQRLTDARAALDARLGIAPVLARSAAPAAPNPVPLVAPDYEDDDEPVRG